MPQKPKVSIEEKIDIVGRCIKGEWGIREAARIVEVSNATIRRWIAKYEAEGADSFIPQERNRVYSPALKQQAVHAYLSGEGSYLDICKKYKIRDEMVLRRWLKVYDTRGDFNSIKFSGGGSSMREAHPSGAVCCDAQNL